MDVREKLVELIGSTEYGKGSLVGNNFQKGFIEKIASNLITNGVTVQGDEDINVHSKWISVKDRLPEDSTYVLARLSGGVIYQALCLTKFSAHWYGANFERFVNKDTVTHWMPLPKPPKGE